MFYCLSLPDAPLYTGLAGVECRNAKFFYWEIKEKIKALGVSNLKCSFSSGNPGESGGESSSGTIMILIEKEGEQMVKMLTSDLRISFWESHYPPLLVSASSTLAFFLLRFWRHTVQGSGFQTFWTLKLSGTHVQEFSMCMAVLESHWRLRGLQFLVVTGFFPGFWHFQYKKRHSSRNASCRKGMETPDKMDKDEG